MTYRKFNSHIKSIIHFDFPYYHEPGDGLSDELGLFTLARAGGAKLVGSEAPADAIVSGTPKFGYRCLQTDGNNSYVQGTGNITFTQTGSYEVSMWVRAAASTQGNILQLLNGSTVLFSAVLTSTLNISCTSSTLGLSLTSEQTLSLNAWTFLRFQFYAGGFTVKVGDNPSSAEGLTSAPLNVTAIRLGGLTGQIDEVILRDTLTDTIPAAPVQARIDVAELGGFGTGSLGNVTISSLCVVSSCAYFSAVDPVQKYRSYIISGYSAGKFGGFKMGDEVLIINPASGEYEFNYVNSYAQNIITLAKDLSQTPVWGVTMIVQVPHFNTLTVNAETAITATQRTASVAGGIIVFRVRGNCTVNGFITSHGFGMPRTDSLQMTHSKLIDNFIQGSGGGIFIACGGTFTATSSARIGATWDGSAKGGVPVNLKDGGDGGAGYGGAGGGDYDQSVGIGGAGGVGGGGGGGNGAAGLAAGSNKTNHTASTGGSGISYNSADSTGGTQGVTIGGNAQGNTEATGGGGAGGDSCAPDNRWPTLHGLAGANLILIAKTLKVDAAAISTGGHGGFSSKAASGGGGTGFCYIACEEMIS